MTKEIIKDDNPQAPVFDPTKNRNDQARGIGTFAGEFKAHARHSDPQTSHDAAAGIKEKLPRLESMVLKSITSGQTRGMNSYEIELATGLPNESCTPRYAPLRRKGFILDSGLRRPGKSGKGQIVWVAKQFKVSS